MTKAERVKALQEQAGHVTRAQAGAAYKKLFALVAALLQQGAAVVLSGFGAFKPAPRAARQGCNPRTGQEIHIPASTSVKFTPEKALTESL
jgi:DNA-binding protein HU-beta